MFFTREDILKIQNALLQLSVKDSELPSAEPVTYDDTLSIVQDGKNKQIKIEDFFNQISLWKREDFINITDKYDEHYISLIEAINLVPVLQRKDGLVITFQDTNGDWRIYQFRDNITEFLNENKWFDLYDYRNYIVQSIVPDEEDLTISIPDENGNSLVHLKDRVYDPTNFNGKGYKILRKNIIDGKNILTQDMINQSNTIYEIRYDFDLNNQDIKLAKGSEIKYAGGSIKNGDILYNDDTVIIKSNSSIKNFKNLRGLKIFNINFSDYVLDTDIKYHNGITGIIVNNVLNRIRESFYSKYQLLYINIPGGKYIINGSIDLKNLYLDFNMSFIHVIDTKPSDTIFYWSSPAGPITPNLVIGGVKNIMQIQQYSDIDKIFDLTNYNGQYGIENIEWVSIGGHANYGLYQPYISEKQSYSDFKYLHHVRISIKRYDDFANKDIVPYNILCLGDGGKIVQCSFNNLCLFGCGGMTVENCENLPLILAYSNVDILSNYCEYLGNIKIINSNIRFIGGTYRLDSRPLYEKYKGDFIRVDVQEDIDNFKNIVYPLLIRDGSREISNKKNSIVDFGNIILNYGNWHYLNSYAGFVINKGNYCKLLNLPIGISVNNEYPTTITYCNTLFNFILGFRKVTDNRVDASFAGTDFSNTSISIIGAFIEIDKERMLYSKFNVSYLSKYTLNSNEIAILENVITNYNNTLKLEFAFNALPLVYVFKINDEIFYGKKVISKEYLGYTKAIGISFTIHKTHYLNYEYTFGNDFLVKDDGFYKKLVDTDEFNSIICYNSNYNLDFYLNKKDDFYNDNGFNAAITVSNIEKLKKISSLKNDDIIYEESTKLKYKVINGTLHNITQISGNTSSRPTKGLYSGFIYYDIDLNKNIVWNGSIWTNIDGTSLNINKSGTTAERPTNVNIGFIYKDTTLNKLILWEGSKWVNLDGSELS